MTGVGNPARGMRPCTGAARLRAESRGAHYRDDFTQQDDGNWLRNITVRLEADGLRFEDHPVAES